MASITHLVTADELLAMGGGDHYELWEGVLREVSPSSARASVIGARLLVIIGQFVAERDLGYTTNADGGYILRTDPHTVVAPDVGFFRRDRFPGGMPERGFFPLPPDLAIEVISPTDEPAEMRRKQKLYSRADMPMVWWVDPEARTVTIHRPDQEPEVLEATETLDGGNVLPGFAIPVERIFAIDRR